AAMVGLVIRVMIGAIAPQYWEAFEDRVVSSLTTNALKSDDPWTFGSRLYEIQTAIGHIGEHPVVGLGVGMVYRDILPFEYMQTEVRENPEDAVRYMHNTYVYFLMKYGLLGALAAVLVMSRFVRRAWVLARGQQAEAVLYTGVLASF